MWYNYSLSDLDTFETDAVAVELDEHQARLFSARLAKDVLTEIPNLASKGICVVMYDIEDQPVSIVPLDLVQ